MNTLLKKETAPAPAKRVIEETFLLPVVNIVDTHEGYAIEAEMPGVPREGLEITLEANTLTLTGRRDLTPPKANALYVESKPAHFRRVFELDPTIDTGKVTAHLEQGLLKVLLPKAERVKPRTITVTD